MIGRKRLALALVVVLAAGVNFAQFGSIDGSRTQYAALGRLETSDIMVAGFQDEQIARSYRFYLALADIAPDSHLVVSTSGILAIPSVRDFALSFGRATQVDSRQYDADASRLLLDDILLSHPRSLRVQANGIGDIAGANGATWQIITGDCSTDRENPREFAFFHTGDASEASVFLIETCVLPADVIGAQ